MRSGPLLRRRVRKRVHDDDRILPLINVVFLLLIFFMVVGRLSASDPFEVVPPNSLSEGVPATDEMLISIGADARVALNGEIVSPEELMTRLAAAEDPQIRIKADGRADAARVVGLIEELRQAGIGSVRLMTVPRLLEAVE